jgi:hypothetical protein
MIIWGFENEEVIRYVTFDLEIHINQIKVLDTSLFFLFPNGETRLLRWDEESKNLMTTMPTK